MDYIINVPNYLRIGVWTLLRLLLVVLFWFRKIMSITLVLFLQYKRVLARIETTLWDSGCTPSSFQISCLSQQLLEVIPIMVPIILNDKLSVTISSDMIYYIQFVHIPRETHILASLLEGSFHVWRVRSEGYLGVSFARWGSLAMMSSPYIAERGLSWKTLPPLPNQNLIKVPSY